MGVGKRESQRDGGGEEQEFDRKQDRWGGRHGEMGRRHKS